MKLVSNFRVDPNAVLAGAQQANLAELVVIGRYANGKLYVAGSNSTPEVLALIDRAPAEINRLAAAEPDGEGVWEKVA